METLKIQIPKGYEVASFDQLTGEIKFKEKPKNVLECIKTISDVLVDHGLTQQQFDKQCEGLEDDEIAYRILKMLSLSLNRGWQPDWNNSNESKYYPYFEMGGSSGFRFHGFAYWGSRSYVGSRLCFISSELAEYAGKQFIEVYKKFMTI